MAKRLENVLIGERKTAEITEPTPIPTLGRKSVVNRTSTTKAPVKARSESNIKDKSVPKEDAKPKVTEKKETNSLSEMKKRVDLLWSEVFPPISGDDKMFKMAGK